MHIHLNKVRACLSSYKREQNCSNNDRLNPTRMKIPILPLSIRYLTSMPEQRAQPVVRVHKAFQQSQ